jgi:hypothetical protein
VPGNADGTDHAHHKKQGSMIRRYIIWRNRHADDRRARAVVDRANVCKLSAARCAFGRQPERSLPGTARA